MKNASRIGAWLLVAAALPVSAADLSQVGTLAQEEFRRLSQDLGAAFSYKGVTPATPLGIAGFDVGIEATLTRMQDSSVFARAGAGGTSDLVIPKFHVHKGLWGGFDIGAFIAGARDVDAALFGAELRYAIVDDGIATPAVGMRLSGSRATGTGDLRIGTAALDVMVSKRFAIVTPYLGGGAVRVESSVRGAPLADESFTKGRMFAGVNLNLLTTNFALEAEKMGGNTSYSAKLGLRF
ncbi:MAG TPA: hypothetical protein VEC19_05035 [Usitatibacter sp.]|nr:hypothetical protein [Usitatibacter sp.]